MTVDHIGAYLYPDDVIFRIIGRLSMPIFCYLIALGFKRTHNKSNYIIRVLAAAIAAQPFMMLMGNNNVNALYGFVGTMGLILSYDSKKLKKEEIIITISSILLILISDYSFLTPALILSYYLPDSKIKSIVYASFSIILYTVLVNNMINLYALVGPVLIILFSHWDYKLSKTFRYSYYPGHLGALCFIKIIFP